MQGGGVGGYFINGTDGLELRAFSLVLGCAGLVFFLFLLLFLPIHTHHLRPLLHTPPPQASFAARPLSEDDREELHGTQVNPSAARRVAHDTQRHSES